ncbi:flagellar basal body P-ring formation protein FlgA [Hahella sp. KA22]|uniref:flagellar basal body P-ring formation chaperone FlgA n=1 Tax=Hahella sp. KA22 TaxID=1628392 RepID=UPI000FDD06E3|nr:flagellar basal body P-ring formation chaperone FlgA [Hahella sp. KA22]AZZ91380.1 flagellar basal body P-ring formation protein FlgA [Hahella sp. KA22]QAY54750.1 flagellar basal body P-ring formation protein FlgA [Hahella sp. KA22]
MKIRITGLMYIGILVFSAPALCNSIPVWRQQTSVAVEEFMMRFAAAAAEQLQERVVYEVSEPDSRLNFSPCEQTPAVKEASSNGGRLTLKVSCDTPSPWQIYVPVQMERYRQIVTIKSAVPRDYALAPEDLETKELNIIDLRYGFYTNTEDVVGMITRRPVTAGSAPYPNMLEAPKLINKGDMVVIEAATSHFSVKMPGVAMADGRRGQQIMVKNSSSNRMVRAEVIGSGHVRTPL